MDYFSKLTKQVAWYVFGLLLIVGLSNIGLWWYASTKYALQAEYIAVACVALTVILAGICTRLIVRHVTTPLKTLSQAILHVSPDHQGFAAPNLNKGQLGRELVTNLALEIYQLASASSALQSNHEKASPGARAQNILDNCPSPIFAIDSEQNIVYTNQAAVQYLEKGRSELLGNNIYSILDLSFSNEDTLDAWLIKARSQTVTASHSWNRVRLEMPNQKAKKQLDMSAYYNKNNPEQAETIIMLFDKTQYYSQDDDGIGFIALAVHELRTPLTMLRGYIEVFEEELTGKLNPELAGFMQKMRVSAQQLSDFVGNILNVARVDENQLFLQLHEEKWPDVLKNAASDMELKAKVHNKKISFDIAGNLPTVAVDRVSIYEVINNLLDNAIKYSDKSSDIIVRSIRRDDGMVETTVQDFGIGIPGSVMDNLFEKFYRNHRSRAQIGGTGLGLYLSKAIVSAHGGQIWVNSKENEGSTFGFTLQPYANVADKLQSGHNKDIVRTAHGWIKNHSFYRR